MVRSLWTVWSVHDIEDARRELQRREKCSATDIAAWSDKTESKANNWVERRIAQWAKTQHLDAVVWTALPPKFDNVDGKIPTVEDAVRHLNGLDDEGRAAAEEYIRKAPRQVDTEYRRRFEMEFGWTPLGQI